ncbi:probable GUK1 - guanylate kinase [Ustilago trichophora]|uniref:Guanylate kinase n=1 Tax=Ustilago trichophora TaxID=86804 RepID=A0A5C3E416_9BASI|nr:probable GUK1 - guanylate kinase [Ustilago trichophora]
MSTSSWASTPPIPGDKRPIVLSGPSGVGKSTLLKKLFEEFPNDFGFSVSHTTRDPRPGEVRGQSYHYVTRQEFEDLVQAGAFLEHAQFGGNRYGTTAKAVADVSTEGVKGADGSTDARRAILDIDAQGVKLIKANHPSLNPIYIFISPPSFSTLKQRLIGRGTETPESVQKRLTMAAKEMEYAREKGAHDWIIVNDDLEKAYGLLKKAINETLKKGEDDAMPAKDQDEEEWEKQQQQQQ